MLPYLEIILLVLGLPILWLIISYNLLVRDKHRVSSAWADIDVQLKRRHDLIPKLIDSVKQYANYESDAMQAITQLRQQSQSLQDVAQKGEIESTIGSLLLNIIAIAEDYPDLKANQSFLDLQQELSAVENALQYARRYYNGAVRNLNIRIDTFPDLFIAKIFGFSKALFFEFDESASK